jgi:hypothetical protein
MLTRLKYKLSLAILAFAVAAVLTATCMVISALPISSFEASYGVLALLGLAVAGAILVYSRSCEWLETRRERHLKEVLTSSSASSADEAARRTLDHRFSMIGHASRLPKPMWPKSHYPLYARGFVRPGIATFPQAGQRIWRGQ